MGENQHWPSNPDVAFAMPEKAAPSRGAISRARSGTLPLGETPKSAQIGAKCYPSLLPQAPKGALSAGQVREWADSGASYWLKKALALVE